MYVCPGKIKQCRIKFFFQNKNPSILAILFSLANLIISRKAFTAQNGYPSMEGAVYFGDAFHWSIVAFCFFFPQYYLDVFLFGVFPLLKIIVDL